ncbi:MAG: Nif3-like dinuclear metal center hexameric protein, partial [Armatimonadota bacterium]|nr:Nif3-like dinuclear metal center hexameric protein [Armatimonadota bacterium]
MNVAELVDLCHHIAAEELAEPWDNVGLQVGNPGREVSRVLACLDVTPATVAEARQLNAQCILAHHPLIFKPLASLREDWTLCGLAAALVRSNIALYVMHTNLDNACPGTTDALADALGVVETRPLVPLKGGPDAARFKLVVFVPLSHAEGVRQAMGDAGAGVLGNYSHCSFSTTGRGSFRPMPGARPAVGAVGTQEEVWEERVEVVVTRDRLDDVVRAMRRAHPYEEVAYDLYPLAPSPSGARQGLGRVGRLTSPVTLQQLVERVRQTLEPRHLR